MRMRARTPSLTVSASRFGRRRWQVAFLVSEDCKESGSLFEVGAGLFTKLRYTTDSRPEPIRTHPARNALPSTRSPGTPFRALARPEPTNGRAALTVHAHSWQRTKGAVFRLDQTFTPGAVAAKWAQVRCAGARQGWESMGN